jgi:hypothetical protein
VSAVILRGDRCRCPACGQLFNSTSAFDKHRAGPWAGRRCLLEREMVALGMERNTRGFWVGSRRPIGRDGTNETAEIGATPYPTGGVT